MIDPLLPVTPREIPTLDDAEAHAPPDAPGKSALREELDRLTARLQMLQRALYAERQRALLVVLQGRDAGGKDGTIRKVFGPLNPQGCTVTVFDRPTVDELDHDYLWRVHAAVPPRGHVGVFNRSHYEDVLTARVDGLVPEERWERRFGHINDWERMLVDEGVVVVKFFLHVSREEQARRLQRRLDDPARNWKFDPSDVQARERWDAYTDAYREVFARCSPEWARWYVVPADDKHLRNVLVARVLVDTLEALDPQFPAPHPAIEEFRDVLK